MSHRSCTELNWEATGRFCAAHRVDGWCSGKRTYRNASAFCAAAGTRLCTSTELAQHPLKNGGCGLNDELVWSSSPCAESAGRRAMLGKGRDVQCFSEDGPQLHAGCCADGAAVEGVAAKGAAAAEGTGTSRRAWHAGAEGAAAGAGAPSFILVMPDDFPRNFLGAAHGLTPTLDRPVTACDGRCNRM